MRELLRQREEGGQVEADLDLDNWMQARIAEGMGGSVATELVLRLLGLEVRTFWHDRHATCVLCCAWVV